MRALDVFEGEFRSYERAQFAVVHQLRDLLQHRGIGLDEYKRTATNSA